MPRRSLRVGLSAASLALLLASAANGCSDTDDAPDRPSYALDGLDGFTVRVEQGNRLIIESADGRVLLDGLPGGSVADGAPPLVGLATRDVVTEYEMQFGAFKPTEIASGAWRAADELVHADATTLELQRGGARIGRLVFSTPEAGHLVVETMAGDGAEKRLSWGFACEENDHFAGFGAQSFDADHRGQTVPTFVTENGIGKSETDSYDGLWFFQGTRHSSHLPIPQYLSSRGYILTTHTPYQATFALCSERDDAARIEVELGTVVHIFDGPAPTTALERASAEFGRPRMPPRVAFAPWLDAIFGSEEVRRVATKLRDEGIPSSAIWTEDWKGGAWYEDDYRLDEEWEVDRDLYPDFEAVADDLHALGFDMHIYFNPFIYEGTKAWDDTAPNGWLVKREDGSDYTFGGAKLTDTGLIDVFHPEARAWAVSKMRDGIALGADGWMHDFAEWLPTDSVTYAGSGADLHNEYAVVWQEIAREAIDGVGDGKERLFFGRSGWFGTPQLADVIWAGDQRTTMDNDDAMPAIIPIGIGLGLVGISTYGHDIAGYQAVNNPGSTREVFYRWTQLGAWSPVMRTHHGNQPTINWNWERDDETIALFRRYAALHMSLVPTMEGLARVASDTGVPIMRHMAIHFPDDETVWPITDQFMVGDSILVAPVVTAGQTSRTVYLPEGRWTAWAGDETFEGPAEVEVAAPLEEIPVFVRAGGVVPMYPDGVMTLVWASEQVPGPESVGDDRVVRIALGASGSFTEASSLSYTLTHLAEAGSAGLSFAYEGDALEPCPANEEPTESCAGTEGPVLLGPGLLRIDAGGTPVAELSINGGAPARRIDIRL